MPHNPSWQFLSEIASLSYFLLEPTQKTHFKRSIPYKHIQLGQVPNFTSVLHTRGNIICKSFCKKSWFQGCQVKKCVEQMYKFYKNVHLYIHFWFHIQELIDVGDTHNFHHVHSTNQTNFEERMCACFMKYVGKYFKNY